ncbi:septation protein A [Morganella morganii]|uniref:Inner membrane-spanning protein YciB n=1 Tax=Morganella morganii TaxID=582 RepID=A0A433ZU96_MORMO|nr:septation protein A [Morganella morganii]RUT65695.1 septation protein A [Morganella morganii]
MKQLLDFIPLVIFFAIYKTVDIYYASGALIAASAVALAARWFMYKHLEKSAVITFVIVAVFGTLTIVFHDPQFIKWKVTIIYALFALVLLGGQFIFGKPLIQKMLGKELTLPPQVWQRLNLAWALFFMVCAAVNVYVAFWLSMDTWMNFKVFGLTAVTLVFTVASVVYIYRHLPREEEK